MRAPQPLHATPHGCGLIAVLLIALIALLVGCADEPVMPSNTLDEAQRVFVVDECWNEGFDARVYMAGKGGGLVIECTGAPHACAAP